MNDTSPIEDRNKTTREEYDYSQAEVGKYAQRYQQGTNIVKLDADVAKDFRTSQAVNEALRRYRELIEKRRIR